MSFGGSEDLAEAFRKRGAAHRAGANVPVVRVSDFKTCSLVARDQQCFVAVGHLIGSAVKGKNVATRIDEGSHAAARASACEFRDCRRFALKGFAFVGRASDKDGA